MRPIRYVLDDCSHVYVALFPGELRLSFELFDWLSWFPRTGGQDQLGGSEGLAQSILLDQGTVVANGGAQKQRVLTAENLILIIRLLIEPVFIERN